MNGFALRLVLTRTKGSSEIVYWLVKHPEFTSCLCVADFGAALCISHLYYIASFASGQDEPNRALWLATRAGKMEPSCPLGTTRCIPQAKFHQKPYNKSFIDQVCSVKMAGYWPRSFFASLWTSTSSRSINTQKKNLANIQPSWPHTWSITHTYWGTYSNSNGNGNVTKQKV